MVEGWGWVFFWGGNSAAVEDPRPWCVGPSQTCRQWVKDNFTPPANREHPLNTPFVDGVLDAAAGVNLSPE